MAIGVSAGLLIVAAAFADQSHAQHADVLVQAVGGKLTTGSADFDSGQWTLGRRVYSGEFDNDFAVNNPGFNALAAGSPALPPGSQALPGDTALGWDFLAMTIEESKSNLFYWDGLESDGAHGLTANDVHFGQLPGPGYALSLFDRSQAKFSVAGTEEAVQGGIIDVTGSDGSLHRHRFYLLEAGTTPADGIYLFAMRLRMDNLESAKPIFMVFGTPGSSVAALDSAAVSWVAAHIDTLVPEELPGDYNLNGAVDAADYVVWRKNLDTNNALPNDSTPGMVSQVDYDEWRAHFGATAVNGADAASAVDNSTTVPEPTTTPLLIVTVAAGLLARISKPHLLSRDFRKPRGIAHYQFAYDVRVINLIAR